MKMPIRLYKWIDRREHVPWIIRKVLWPGTHFCVEMDYLLVASDNKDNCFCGMWPCNEKDRLYRYNQIDPKDLKF